MTEATYLAGLLYSIEVHALVLMPNHFHMLVTIPQTDLGRVMNHFLSSVTKTVNLVSAPAEFSGGPITGR